MHQSHEINVCFPQGAPNTLANYRRQKFGFGASWDDEVIDSSINWRIINFNLEVMFHFVDAVPIFKKYLFSTIVHAQWHYYRPSFFFLVTSFAPTTLLSFASPTSEWNRVFFTMMLTVEESMTSSSVNVPPKSHFPSGCWTKLFPLHMYAKILFAHRLETAKMAYFRTTAKNNDPKAQCVLPERATHACETFVCATFTDTMASFHTSAQKSGPSTQNILRTNVHNFV